MKPIPVDIALDRVFRRQPYANHWGQRLLGFHTGALRSIADGICAQIHVGLIAFFASMLACVALLPSYLPHGSSQKVALVSSIIAFLGCVFFLRCLAWTWVGKPIVMEQIESMQAWMLDHSNLTEAAAHWIKPGETLRQRDYRLLKWAHCCIVADKHQTAIKATQVKGDHPLLFWTKRSLDLVQKLGGNACSTLPSDMATKQRERLTLLATKLANAHYPQHMTLSHKQGETVSSLHYSGYLSKHGMRSLFVYPTLTGFGEAIGALVILSCFGGAYLFMAINLVFHFYGPLEGYQAMGNTIAWAAASLLTLALIVMAARKMSLAMGSAPLSPVACHKLGELTADHPVAANLFFAQIPSGRYLTYDHFQIFWKMVMAARIYERSKEEQRASKVLAVALESLPAAKISAAREEARLIGAHTVLAAADTSTRRL